MSSPHTEPGICECGHPDDWHLRCRLSCFGDEGDCPCVVYRPAPLAVTEGEESADRAKERPESAPDGEACMVFNEHGNTVDSFPYTAEALRRAADKLDGTQTHYFAPGEEGAQEASTKSVDAPGGAVEWLCPLGGNPCTAPPEGSPDCTCEQKGYKLVAYRDATRGTTAPDGSLSGATGASVSGNTAAGEALSWLMALRDAEREWRATDYRTAEYGRRVNDVIHLVRRDYILNALATFDALVAESDEARAERDRVMTAAEAALATGDTAAAGWLAAKDEAAAAVDEIALLQSELAQARAALEWLEHQLTGCIEASDTVVRAHGSLIGRALVGDLTDALKAVRGALAGVSGPPGERP